METIHRTGAVKTDRSVEMKMSIGVDLHKSQFTVCFFSEDRKIEKTEMFSTRETGYEDFLSKCNEYLEKGYALRAAVESTGNARYFRNRLITNGIDVVVVNTLKFKVVNESVKKTDKHDYAARKAKISGGY